MKHFYFSLLVTSLCFLCPAFGAVTVDFSHTYTGGGTGDQNTGDILLTFTVDAVGNVVLDASCVASPPSAYVDDFDGPVGTVSDSSFWGQSFTLTLSGGILRIDNAGLGLAYQGQNAQRIDNAEEVITVELDLLGAALDLATLEYANSNGTSMQVDSAVYPISGSSGSANLSTHDSLSTFTLSSAADADSAGFVWSGLSFDLEAVPVAYIFDNSSGNSLWQEATNWGPDLLPVAPDGALIQGQDVLLNVVLASGPSGLTLDGGALTVAATGGLSLQSAEIGTDLESNAELVLRGGLAGFSYSGSSVGDVFRLGSAGTVETVPDNSGSSPLELGAAALSMDAGSQWILDGADYTGSYTVGDRFVLANYGSFVGSVAGVRTRNFDIPGDRDLRLVNSGSQGVAGSLYYEIVAQTAAVGPNVIIVYLDDMTAGHYFGFEGRPCNSPTIDSLAANGINFSQAMVSSTICSPSRYSLLTGRHAQRCSHPDFLAAYPLGTIANFENGHLSLEEDGQNIAAWLQQAGYRTGFVGKSHVMDHDMLNTVNWASFGLMTYSSNVDPASNSAVNAAIRHNHRMLAQYKRSYGFDFVDSIYQGNLKEQRNDHLNGHNQEWITRGALRFIDENHDQRFFLYMAPTVDHGPISGSLTRSLKWDPRYTGEGYDPDVDFSFMPTRQSIINEVQLAGHPLHSARMTWVDYSMQAILNKLDEHGVRDDTLLIFMSDHGHLTQYDSPSLIGKASLFEPGLHVPMLMYWPNGIVSPGRTCDAVVQNIDFVPTLLELAGASTLPTRTLDGSSLVSILGGSNTGPRDEIYGEVGYCRGIRTKDWKYVAIRYSPDVYQRIDEGYLWTSFPGETILPRPYYVGNRHLGHFTQINFPTYFDADQLYDLNADPTERVNVYDQHPDIVYDMKKRLSRYTDDFLDRPFREFSDASTEFAPAPLTPPAAPANVQIQFLGTDTLQLDWEDAAVSELGYIVEQSVESAAFEIVAEVTAGTTSTQLGLSSAEDLVLRVSSYNQLGDTAASSAIDLLQPESWRFRTFGDIDSELVLPVSQWLGDGDGDGLSNLLEYAYGTDSLSAGSYKDVGLAVVEVGDRRYLELKVPVDERRSVQVSAKVATDLTIPNWDSGILGATLIEETDGYLLFRSTVPIESEAAQFMSAEIVLP